MNAISYKQLRAFAAQYGAVVGLMWIVSFAFYIIGLTRPLVGNVGLIIGLLSVVTAGFLIRKFRGEVFPLRFGQSWWMATLIFMYASLPSLFISATSTTDCSSKLIPPSCNSPKL